MKIAIVGSGISGLTAAYILNREHDIVVYEAAGRIGGHTATIDVDYQGQQYAIDTGFIVFNDWTYPNFKALLKQLNVAYQPAEMGFSVACEQSGLEYSGNNISTLFAQRRNIFSVQHWIMIKNILRFNKEAIADVESGGAYLDMTLGQYLKVKRYSSRFVEKYLIPMGAAIWSASLSVMQNFPLPFFVYFFRNHGLLSVNDRPQWHVIKGGSRGYLSPLIASFKEKIKTNTPVTSIVRRAGDVQITTSQGSELYDEVVVASHSDQALSMLADPSEAERHLLSSIPYQKNEVVLHTDSSLLPKARATWSSWNYRIVGNAQEQGLDQRPPVLTYNMNILQSLACTDTFCVTLNHKEAIAQDKILGTYCYHHPVFSTAAVQAQQKWETINGVNRTWFCGAYWQHGFHEDGVVSALKVAEKFGLTL